MKSATRAALVLSTMFVTGCHEYGPLSAAPVPDGRRQFVELLLNERGRSDFVDRIGPDALSVEGVLVQRQDSSITIDVQSVSYINRTTSKWTGERLSIATSQLRDVRARRFSRGRTFLAVGGSIGAFVAFVVTRSILVKGQSPPPGGGGTPIDQ